MRRRIAILFLVFCLAFVLGVRAKETAPLYQTPKGCTDIVITFGGDCTLGSEDRIKDKPYSFDSYIAERGMAYPFENLRPLFEKDDLTVVNFEGVLLDEIKEKAVKTYCFRGPQTFANILTQGSVEAVTLGNNHTGDYGQAGFASTVQALDKEGIRWFVECPYANQTYIYEKNGIKIGMIGLYISYWMREPQKVTDSMRQLKEAGCNVIVANVHGGVEYAHNHDDKQNRVATFMINKGADMVIMHHPHVLQGIEIIGNATVVYSLGNLVFGGNKDIRQKAERAVIAQMRLVFDEKKAYLGHQMTLYPVLPSGAKDRVNDYRPVFAQGEEAEAAMRIIQKDTLFPLYPYVEGKGAVQAFVPFIPEPSATAAPTPGK